MAEPSIPQLQVTEILDNTTIVVSGSGASQLHPDEKLWVVGVGPVVGTTNLPLVVPKTTVVVTMVSPGYVIARPEAKKQQVESPSAFTAIHPSTRTVWRREPMKVEEKSLAGNPGRAPVRVGDPVVRPADVQAFVTKLAHEKKSS